MVPTKYVNAVDYLEKPIQVKERKRIVNNAVRTIRKFIAKLPYHERPKAIACSGLSGLLVAPAIADRLGLDLIIVRKHDDTSTHSHRRVEGVAADQYIIVDDLICSGHTLGNIIRQINRNLCEYSQCVGAYLYHTNWRCPKARPMLDWEEIEKKLL